MGEEESIQCQEEKEDQVRDQVDEESGSPIDAPFVLQQTWHHWVPQQVCMWVWHLHHNREENNNTFSVDV